MATPKFTVSNIAQKMRKSEKDVILQLRSLGAEMTDDADQVLEPEVIQAIITGKKLTLRTRSELSRQLQPSTPPESQTRVTASPSLSRTPQPSEPRQPAQEASMGELLWTLRKVVDRERQQAS